MTPAEKVRLTKELHAEHEMIRRRKVVVNKIVDFSGVHNNLAEGRAQIDADPFPFRFL